MVDLTPFQASISAARESLYAETSDPRDSFLAELQKCGFAVKIIEIGRIVRCDGPNDTHGKKTGWYVYNEFPAAQGVIGVGSFGSWRGDIDKQSWCSRSARAMSFAEQATYQAQIEKFREERDRMQAEVYTEAAALAVKIVSDAPECVSHPYLTKKGISASKGLKTAQDGRLIVPVLVDGGAVSSLQFIDAAGEKRFLTGGKTKGGYFKIDGNSGRILVCEGYATGATLHEATGATVYIAFNCGNLYEVSGTAKKLHPDALITICADNDQWTPNNPGMTAARQAADSLGVRIICPEFTNGVDGKPTDFNDLAALSGINAVKSYFKKSEAKPYKKPENMVTDEPPPGFLYDVFSYYNATSGNRQPGFAAQTALAVASIVLSRSFKTDRENFSSLYFLNIGKSGTGKEHPKTVIEKIMHAANAGHMIAGDGYTSAGAVFSALLDRPRHISVIDEFGRYLEAGQGGKNGNHHQREANTKIMECFGRAGGVIRPPTYSTMTLKKDAADALKNRVVYCPALTVVAMTTPGTFFKTINMDSVKDGFINRFLILISDAEREIRAHKPPIDVPESIVAWINSINHRGGTIHTATDNPQCVIIPFSQRALDLQNEFQRFCIDMANALEKYGMEELPGRAAEIAMRVSLIVALSKNPKAEIIDDLDMIWAINYVKTLLETTVRKLKMSVSHTDYEASKKEILQAIRDRSPDGIRRGEMSKAAPFAKHKKRDLDELLDDLVLSELVVCEFTDNSGKAGRPAKEYRATE